MLCGFGCPKSRCRSETAGAWQAKSGERVARPGVSAKAGKSFFPRRHQRTFRDAPKIPPPPSTRKANPNPSNFNPGWGGRFGWTQPIRASKVSISPLPDRPLPTGSGGRRTGNEGVGAARSARQRREETPRGASRPPGSLRLEGEDPDALVDRSKRISDCIPPLLCLSIALLRLAAFACLTNARFHEPQFAGTHF